MDISFGLGMLIGLGATVILMYLVLRKYTYPAVEQPFFSDPMLFFLFALGLVAGTILFVVSTYFTWNNLIYAILLSVIECFVMLVVLNLKRFHGKSDTVFYGYGLGLGIGGAMACGLIYMISVVSASGFDALAYAIVCIMAVAQVMVIGAVGTTIGEGIARLRPWEFLMKAIIINTLFMICRTVTVMYINDMSWLMYLGVFAMIAVAVWAFYTTMYKNLSAVVSDVLRMEGKKRDDMPR
jgi:hypothetical protein